ncbi:MAG: HsdR family type I site-specific deoxyribonuclease [Candidatus Paceibacterota bacterium]
MNQPEQKLTTDYIKDQLVERGWNFVVPSELGRDSVKEVVLENNLIDSIKKINENLDITDYEIDEVIQKLRLENNSLEGSRKILDYIKYGIGVKFKEDRVVRNIKLIDYDNLKNNEFIISREVAMRGKDSIRTDILLFVNGIPLVNIEGKNPAAISATWKDAYNQIGRYKKSASDLYKFVQMGVAIGAIAKYFPVVPWNDEEVRTYGWKEEDKDNIGSIIEFLSPERVIDFIRNYTFIREEGGAATKVMARYMQHRASNKIYERVVKNLKGESDKNKGLIWHWQGSGKTLTMIMAAHKLRFEELLNNPTLLFVIDRVDLEEQLSREVSYLDLNFKVETIGSIKELKEFVKADEYKGKRGAFITLMHKFNPNQDLIPKEIKEKANKGGEETLAHRRNVVVFLDEVQRTQYGNLAAQMKNVLDNAFYFGFTGTPISKLERNTYREFGYPIDEGEEYLDRYFIDESQEDGFTVPIIFEPRKEEFHMTAEALKEFLENVPNDVEGYEGKDERVNNKIAKKLTTTKVFLEKEDRIEKISEDIASHFKENVDGKFKGMIVAGSRKACVLYKKKLDEIIDENASEVVMTFNAQEKEKEIGEYYKIWKKKYSGEDKEIVDKIVTNFKEKENPKILIVTSMLLTGFDAPKLQTMYFDKPLKEHTLLQAIARVNRIYKDVKEAGVVVDYVGVVKRAKEALKNYYDLEDMSSAIFDYDAFMKKLLSLINEIEVIIGKAPEDLSRGNLNEAIDILRDWDKEKEFISKYKELRKVYELLGSHKEKLDIYDRYKWISSVYAYYMNLKGDERDEVNMKAEVYFKDTLKIVHDTVLTKNIKKDLPPFKLDRDYFDSLKDDSLDKKQKVMNNVFGLEKLVLVENSGDPILQSVYDKVEILVRKWREKSVDTDELYDLSMEVINELDNKTKEREELDLDDLAYGFYMKLKEILKDKDKSIKTARSLYESIKDDIDVDDGWLEHSVLHNRILKEIKEFSRKIKVQKNLSLDEMNEIYKELKIVVENYGKEN